MIAVVIEPALLAVPPIASSEDEVEAIIDRLSAWSSCLTSGGVLRIAQMSDTTDVLGETNCWPTGPNVTALLELYGLDHVYSPVEVTRLINTILERSITVQMALGFEVTKCTPYPGQPVAPYQAPQLEAAGNNTFATLAAGVRTSGIFLAPANFQNSNQFRGEVQDISKSQGISLEITPPFSVFGSVVTVKGPSCVCDALSANDIWNVAQTSIDIHFSILMKMGEIQKSNGQPIAIEKLPAFFVGSDFADSLRANQAGSNSQYGQNVLESCARLILEKPKNAVDPFMKGPRSSNQEQWMRGRDGMLAFRTHVTKKGAGLRLVFWQSATGTIELANVAVHDDLTLCEGVKAGVAARSW
jgi:hypothetical protein